MHISADLLHVVVAAIITMAIGAVWYSKVLFANSWAAAAGRKMDDIASDDRRNSMILMFVGALVMNYVLAVFINNVGASTASEGAMVGFWAWLGFVVTAALASTTFEGRPWRLFQLFIGYQLIAMLVSGAILAVWS